MKEKIMSSSLNKVKELYIAGNGEVFLSKVYEEIWRSPIANNANTIRVLTNGMLLTPKRWKEFYTGKERVNIWLYVSIDAATKETYEMIRRGGNFDILKKNMEFASKLRKEGIIKYFRINFVVQRKNYLEMEQFIRWGIELGVDNVFFTKILNWGTYTDEEFANISMMELDNKSPKEELKRILDKEIFKNPIVDLGTIQYSRNRVLPDYVDNYYVWETRDWMEKNRKAYVD
jgi:MoaA/NifB/PqqE/SkfB family radical SAM enzyme